MSKVIYSKYSNERARKFALRTDIVADHDRCYVKKIPLYPEGRMHVENIGRWYQELSQRYGNTKIHMNQCGMQQDYLMLEYLEGPTLENILDTCLMRGDVEGLVSCLLEYLDEVKKGFWLGHFDVTPEFEKVFGHVELPQELEAGDIVDIDMVLNNVLVQENEWNLIDYEWTFEFPIPYHFVVYRILLYYLNGNSARNSLHELNLMEKAGLTREEIQEYEKMERHFQDIYVTQQKDDRQRHIPIRDLYEEVSPGVVDLTGLRFQDQSERAARMVQLYQAPDLGFTEEHSEMKKLHKEGVFLDYFSVEPSSRYVRLDPCSKYCMVKNLRMQWGQDILNYRTNGILIEDGSLFFPLDDPQIIVERPEGGMGDFRVYFEIEYLSLDEALYQMQKLYGEQRRALEQAKQQVQRTEETIRAMENTKVWKAYRKIKRN